jgi:hypothetical protein
MRGLLAALGVRAQCRAAHRAAAAALLGRQHRVVFGGQAGSRCTSRASICARA